MVTWNVLISEENYGADSQVNRTVNFWLRKIITKKVTKQLIKCILSRLRPS